MNGVYLLLIAVALIGLLPLAVILIKKRRADRIIEESFSSPISKKISRMPASLLISIVGFSISLSGT